MKLVHLAFPAVFFALSSPAVALCTAGAIAHCSINGKPGTKECLENGRFTPCEPTDGSGGGGTGGNGTVTLKYKVLTVIYPPPGTKGGNSASEVSYASGSTTGSTTTTSHSFKQDYSVSASVSADAKIGVGGGGGASFEYTKSAQHSDALEIKKSGTSTIQMQGPPVDGIDHDRDEIWLWLGPKASISVSGQLVSWTFDGAQTADIQFIHVGWLKDPSTMPPALTQRLQQYGISPQDYPEILKADPLAACQEPVATMRSQRVNIRPPLPELCFTPNPGPPRYVSLNTTFPYEPPFAQGDPATTFKFSLDTSTMSTLTDIAESDYKIGITAEISYGFADIWKASLKTDDSWTWTDTATTAGSTGSTQSISVTIGGPAFGYTGPTDMAVYYDQVYQTFAFAPVVAQPRVLHGVIMSNDRKPIAGQEVIATVAGVKHRTYTNANGEYHFPSRFVGTIDLQAGGLRQRLPEALSSESIDLRF